MPGRAMSPRCRASISVAAELPIDVARVRQQAAQPLERAQLLRVQRVLGLVGAREVREHELDGDALEQLGPRGELLDLARARARGGPCPCRSAARRGPSSARICSSELNTGMRARGDERRPSARRARLRGRRSRPPARSARSSRASPAVATNSRRQPSRNSRFAIALDAEAVRIRLHHGRALAPALRRARSFAKLRASASRSTTSVALRVGSTATGGELCFEDRGGLEIRRDSIGADADRHERRIAARQAADDRRRPSHTRVTAPASTWRLCGSRCRHVDRGERRRLEVLEPVVLGVHGARDAGPTGNARRGTKNSAGSVRFRFSAAIAAAASTSRSGNRTLSHARNVGPGLRISSARISRPSVLPSACTSAERARPRAAATRRRRRVVDHLTRCRPESRS